MVLGQPGGGESLYPLSTFSDTFNDNTTRCTYMEQNIINIASHVALAKHNQVHSYRIIVMCCVYENYSCTKVKNTYTVNLPPFLYL